MSDLYKTLLISRPQVLSSGGSGLLVAANNLSDVADVTTARTNLGAVSALTVETLPSTLASRGYVYSDGTTSNRAQIQTPGTRGNLAGAPVASWVGWVDVPSVTTAGVAYFGISSSASSTFVANSIAAVSSGGSDLIIRAFGATTGDSRLFTNSSFRTTYSGQRIWLEVRFTKGTGNPVVRVNGTDISSSFTASTAGTPPEWLDSSLVATNHLTGFTWPAGPAPLGSWLNAHLGTDAQGRDESDQWRITGRPPAWVALGGSQVASLPASAFTNSQYETFAAASVTGFSGINTTGGGVAGATFASNFPAGARLRVFYSLVLNSGTAPTLGFQGESSSAFPAMLAGNGLWLDLAPLTAPRNRLEVNLLGGSTDFVFTLTGVARLGALSLPGIQPINVLDDWTGIGGNQARLVGIAPITERRDWRIAGSTATNGNQQLLGGDLLAEPTRHRINSWVVNNTGGATRTVSLGNTSGGTAYANAVSCPVGRTDITPTTRFPTTAAFWVNSNGTDQLVHTITGHRVGSS